jgi:S1-C subfamily serine protease
MTDPNDEDPNQGEAGEADAGPTRPVPRAEDGHAPPPVTSWWTPPHAPSGFDPPPPSRRQHSAGAVVIAALLAALVAGFAGVGVARFVTDRRAAGPTLGDRTAGFSRSQNGSVPSPAAGSVAAKLTPAVVDITTNLAFRGGVAAGTGMVLTASGEVLTNNHVISGASSIRAQIGGTGRTYSATVVGTDATNDVAVLQLQNASGLATVARGDAATVKVGDTVVAIGNALGQPGPPAVVTGAVRALNQEITVGDPASGVQEQLSGLVRIDAPLQPGDSGGPLADRAGRVIGMNTAASISRRFQPTAPEGYAIPINHALDIAVKIEAGQSSDTIQIGRPAYLGVEIVAPSQADSALNGYTAPSPNGAVVAGVQPGTPAEATGLTAGDEIVRFDGRTVDSPATLKTILKGHHPGDRVSIRWLDSGGATHDATIQLGAGPPN